MVPDTMASMGPRPSDRGRRPQGFADAGEAVELQWVHGLLTVGDACARAVSVSWSRLQWVHGLLTVGDIEYLSPSSISKFASMGPRPSDRGRLQQEVAKSGASADASMGPRPSDRGRQVGPWSSLFTVRPLQWVHGLLTVGDFKWSNGLQRGSRCFNGSTAF